LSVPRESLPPSRLSRSLRCTYAFHPFGASKLSPTDRNVGRLSIARSSRRRPPTPDARTTASMRGSDVRRALAHLASARPASPGASRTCEAVCGRRPTPWPAWLGSEPAARCPAEWSACHRRYRARADCGDAAAGVVRSPIGRSRASGRIWKDSGILRKPKGRRILIGPSIHIDSQRRGWQLSAAGGPTLRPSDSGRSSGPVRDLPPTNRPNGYALRVIFACNF